MRTVIAAIVLIGLMAAGCRKTNPPTPPLNPGEKQSRASQDISNNISANSFFGSVNIRALPGFCAGRIQLAGGAATVSDSCFTGDTNIVLCTDISAANPIRCAPAKGSLAINGNGGDLISYARVR
jgi:hypothetical protein